MDPDVNPQSVMQEIEGARTASPAERDWSRRPRTIRNPHSELMLFPFIEQHGSAQAPGKPPQPVPLDSIASPIGRWSVSTSSPAMKLAEIRQLTHDFESPLTSATRFTWKTTAYVPAPVHSSSDGTERIG